MATLISKATGNLTASGTWLPISNVTAAELDSENNNSALTTSFVYSATFTPLTTPGGDIDGVAIKISSVAASPTGTITVTLANNTSPGTQEGTTTINVSDIDPAGNGWYLFKFAAVQPNGTDVYKVGAKTSSAAQVNLFRDGTAGNWARMLRNSGTAANIPAASDKLMMMGEWTAAATLTSFTITMDSTATTSYGPTVSGGPPQGMVVCKGATFSYGTTASTAYYLKLKGILQVYGGATFNMCTSGTRMPSTSSGILEFDVVGNVDSGLVCSNGSIVNAYGNLITNTWTTLTANKAAAATVIALASTAGWSNNDVVLFTDTDSRGSAHWETKTILTVDSPTQITLTAGLTNAHGGVAPVVGECGNLTRNVKIRGISTSLQAYMVIGSTAVVNFSSIEIYQLGSNTSGKRGIDIQTTTGTFFPQYCSLHDGIVNGSAGFNITGVPTAAVNVNIDSNVVYNFNSQNSTITGAIGSINWTINNNLVVGQGSSAGIISLTGGPNAIFTNNTMQGGANASVMTFAGQVGTWSGNSFHNNTGNGGLQLNNVYNSTLTGLNIWRCPTSGLGINACVNLTLVNPIFFGNANENINFANSAFSINITITGMVSNGDTTFSTPTGIALIGANTCSVINLVLENASMSQVSGIKTAHTQDFNLAAAVGSYFTATSRNSLHGSTLVASMSSMQPGSYVNFQALNQIAGNHKSIQVYGITSIDTTISDVSPSERLTPNNASNKYISAPICKAVDSGNTVTATVKIRQSSNPDGDSNSYTGGLPNLKVLKNVAAGIAADTVLATATSAYNSAGGNHGQFQILSGTTIAVTDDAVLTFVVDCDGTAGWINVDTASAA